MKPDTIPVQQPVRNVPESQWEALKKELNHLEKLEVISRITKTTDGPTTWFMLTYPTISHYIVRHPHDNSNFNNVLMTLSRGKCFSTMDVKPDY